MEDPMILHDDEKVFRELIEATSQWKGIHPVIVEKDYRITQILENLSSGTFFDSVVFKGGTSLSKGYRLIERFSEDVDIAVLTTADMTGNRVKTLIRNIERSMVTDFREVHVNEITSKGSRFRRSVYKLPLIFQDKRGGIVPGNIVLEINSFSNPYPYHKTGIQSFITDFLIHIRRQDYIEKYGLHSFPINILDKTRTLVEKLVSLVRFSLADDPIDSLSGKIRHFYDLYYLMKDDTCISFVDSDEFKKVFWETLNHDREIFDEPQGWNKKDIEESVLFYKFDQIWSTLKQGYNRELSMLAFSEIPDENKIAENFENLISLIKPG